MEVSGRPMGRPRLRRTSSLNPCQILEDALFLLIFASIVDAKARNFQIIPLKFVFRAERLYKTEKQIMTSLTKSLSSEASRKSTDSNRQAYPPDFWTLS